MNKIDVNQFIGMPWSINTQMGGFLNLTLNDICFKYRTYLICSAPSNCATLWYYSKDFIFVSRNNFNCIASSNSTVPYFCKYLSLVLSYLKYSYPSQSKLYIKIVLVNLDGHETIKILVNCLCTSWAWHAWTIIAWGKTKFMHRKVSSNLLWLLK